MFRVAALFNVAVAIALGFFHQELLPWLGMPDFVNPAFLQLFLALVFVFGIGYFWISIDFEKNRNIIKLGVAGKLAVVFLLLLHAVLGNVSWRLAALGLVDLWFAKLFMNFLTSTETQSSK